MKKISLFLTIILIIGTLFSGCGVEKVNKIDFESYKVEDRIFMFKVWNFEVMSTKLFQNTVDTAKEDGFNMIVIHLLWANAERKEGEFKFEPYIEMTRYALEKGMKVGYDVDLLRVLNDRFLDEKTDIMYSRDGKKCVGENNNKMRTQFSFCSENAVSKAVKFYKTFVETMEKEFPGKIYCYIPTFTQYAETEYWVGGGELDYSVTAVNAFREWLKNKFGTTEELNKKLETTVFDIDTLDPPSTKDATPIGIQWYIFRHEKLKNVIDRLSEAQHAVAPDSKMAVQFGSVFDSASVHRATLNFPKLTENVQIMWVDDSPTYDHNFSIDYVRSNVRPELEIANEIDSASQDGASKDAYLKQGNESFKFGCKIVNIANWSANGDAYRSYKPVWNEIADNWTREGATGENVIPAEDTPEITATLTEIYARGTSWLRDKFNELSENGQKFVWIKITDDFS